MQKITITWQRLVEADGQTCPRCGNTGENLALAVKSLQQALQPLGIEVVLESRTITPQAFQGDPLQSNRIWIAGTPLEEWLGADTGSSRCCSSCGDSECRTLSLDAQEYESIPVELVVKAGLLAAARLVQKQSP